MENIHRRTDLRSHNGGTSGGFGRFKRFRVQTPQESVLAVFERFIQSFEHDHLLFGSVRPQVDTPESNCDRRIDGTAAENELNSSFVQESLHANESFGSREVDTCRLHDVRTPSRERSRRKESSPLAMEKSRTRNRIGSFVQLAASRIFLIVASQLDIVPKKRKPCNLMTRICLPTSLRKAVCFGCLRTVERATDPVRIERIALL